MAEDDCKRSMDWRTVYKPDHPDGKGAKLEIENNMISFRDGTTLRARWGFDGEQYVFEMYEPDGITKTLYFDEAGEMWINGSLTSKFKYKR